MSRRACLCAVLAALCAPALGQEVAEIHASPVRRPVGEVPVDSGVGTRLFASDPGSTVRVLTRHDLDAMPGRTVADVLRALPEIQVTRIGLEGTLGTLSLRGAGPGGTLVLVDGDPVNDPGSPLQSMDLAFPVDAVERIEVLSGDASALYGPGAVGGAVNVVTRGADLGRSNLQCETRDAHGSRSLDTGTYRGAGRITRALGVGFEVARTESSGARDGTDLETDAAHVAARLDTALGSAKVSAAFADRGFGARGFYTGGPELAREKTRTRSLAAALEGTVGGFRLDATVSVRAHHDDFSPETGAGSTVSDTDSFRARVTGRTELLGASVLLGGEAARETIRAGFADTGRDHGAVFLELARPFLSAAPARGGAHLAARLDSDEGFGSRLSPRVSLWFAPVMGLRVRASAGLSYRLPAFAELYGNDVRALGDPALRAETSKGVEAGASVDVGPFTADVSVFARRGRHVIDETRAADTEGWRVVQRDRLDVDGLSARLGLERGLGRFLTMLALQTSVVSVKNADAPVAGSLLDPVHVRWDALVGLALPSARLRAFTRVTVAARRTQGGEATQDARLGWQVLLGDVLEVYVEGENLWNRGLADEPVASLAGRRLLAGFHLTW
jgi:vitamin B12 transporter